MTLGQGLLPTQELLPRVVVAEGDSLPVSRIATEATAVVSIHVSLDPARKATADDPGVMVAMEPNGAIKVMDVRSGEILYAGSADNLT